MKIILLAASSVDGFITRSNESNIYEWTSSQDSKQFFKKIEQAKLIFMGAKTYGTARHFIKHKEGRLRIVFTKNPERYKSEEMPGFLEFTSNDPTEIVKKYKKIDEALLVGGSEINSLFFSKDLVSEIHLTIEPLVFGDGKKIANSTSKKLKLLSCKQLNKKGTLLLKYKVLS